MTLHLFNVILAGSFFGTCLALCVFWATIQGWKLEQSKQRVPPWIFAAVFGPIIVALAASLSFLEDPAPQAPLSAGLLSQLPLTGD